MTGEIAIAHKDYDVRGGGEILAERLARAFDCPLYIGHGDPRNQPDDMDLDIREIAPDSRWHRVMDYGGAPRGIAHMFHWRDNAEKALGDYDTIITSGNEPLWYMPRDQQTIIAYTHSTPRWMYDLYHESDGFVGRTYQQLQRRLYEGTPKRPDIWVANSDLVARRISRYWNIPSDQIRVVYPPVDVKNYDPSIAETGDYYLYVGRLAGHKRVDRVVDALNGHEMELKIAGRGPEYEALEKLAHRNVEMLGYVSEQKKRELYAGAKALIFPAANEDFGMVPVEALASGTPVLGVDEGFTQFQVREGKNGLLTENNPGAILNTVQQFEREGVSWVEEEIASWTREHFGVEQFNRQMQAIVEEAEELSRVDADLPAPPELDQPPVTDGGN